MHDPDEHSRRVQGAIDGMRSRLLKQRHDDRIERRSPDRGSSNNQKFVLDFP
jgi:hypothetical protein